MLRHSPLAMSHISESPINRCKAIDTRNRHEFGPVEVKSVQAEMTRTAHSTKVLETPPPMRYGIVMVIQSVAPAHAKLGWDQTLRPPHLIHDTAAALSSGPILPPANARPADCAAQHYLLFQTTTTTWQSSGAKKKKN